MMTMEDRVSGLEEALAFGGDTHTVMDVLDHIERGDAKLWLSDDALIVTEVHEYPRKRVLHFWLATGEIASVIELSHCILAQAKDDGFDQATLAGRKGWERVLGSQGWSPSSRVMIQEL